MEFREGVHPIECPFEFPDILGNVFGDKSYGLLIDGNIPFMSLCLENRDTGFEIWSTDIGDHSAFESGSEAVLKCGDSLRWAITRYDYLFVELIKSIEDMEKLYLSLLFSGEKLDVIDDQKIHLLIIFLELVGFLRFDRINQFSGEPFGCDVFDFLFRRTTGYFIADRLEKMCFSEPDSPIDEEWVIDSPEILGNGITGGFCELVVFSYDEIIKKIPLIQIGDVWFFL